MDKQSARVVLKAADDPRPLLIGISEQNSKITPDFKALLIF